MLLIKCYELKKIESYFVSYISNIISNMSSIGITPDELSERFKRGLENYDLTLQEIIESGWKY